MKTKGNIGNGKELGIYGRRALWLIFAVLCYLLAVCSYQRLAEGEDFLTVQLTGALPGWVEGMKIRELEEEQTEPVDCTFWNSLGEQTVQAPETCGRAKTRVLLLCGPSQNLLPEAYGLEADDAKGCLLDEKTAYALFGSTKAVGGQVEFQGKTYRVRQVAPGQQGFLMVQGKEGENVFPWMSLFLDGERRRERMEEFFMRYRLEGQLLDSSLLSAADLTLLLLLPVLLVWRGMGILRECGREAKGLRERVFCGLGIFALAAVLLLGVSQAVEFPRELVPSEWSDFAFWGERLREKQEGLSCYLSGIKSPGQVSRQRAFFTSVLFGLASCLGYGRLCRIKSPEARLPAPR